MCVAVVVYQLLSHVQLFAIPWTIACRDSLSSTFSQTLLKFMSTDSVMLSNHPVNPFSFAWCFPSICVFSNELVLPNVWPRYRSFSFSINPSNIQGWFPLGLTGLISLLSKGPSRVFSSTTVQKHQFFGTQFSLWTNSHMCT